MLRTQLEVFLCPDPGRLAGEDRPSAAQKKARSRPGEVPFIGGKRDRPPGADRKIRHSEVEEALYPVENHPRRDRREKQPRQAGDDGDAAPAEQPFGARAKQQKAGKQRGGKPQRGEVGDRHPESVILQTDHDQIRNFNNAAQPLGIVTIWSDFSDCTVV